MNKTSFWIAAFAITAFAQSGQPLREIESRLTANGLKADVSFLASDALQGRGTPSPGLEVAAEYIAAQFRRAGLEPVGDDGYFQNAAFATVTPNPEGLSLSLEADGRSIQADKATILQQDPVAIDLQRAPAIFADRPAALQEFAPEQTAGKALLVKVPPANPMLSMRMMASQYDRLKPAIVILLLETAPPAPQTGRPREMSQLANRRPMLIVTDPAVLAAAASKDVTVSVRIPQPAVTPARLHNVVGVLRGSDPQLKDTYVLVTAHYDHLGVRGSGPGDHIFNGANDDGSGTASVIEIANALAALPARPKRSIVFIALFGEELGLLGSRYYAAHPIFPLSKTVADLNLEQLGRTDVDGGTRLGLVNVTGYDFSTVTDMLRNAGQETGLTVAKDEKNSDAFFARSDNQALADAGVPAHTLSVGYVFPDYHGAGDEWPKLDYDNMAKVDRTIALAVYRIADSVQVPQWNAANSKTEKYVKARQQN